MRAEREPASDDRPDEIEAAISWHAGDMRATIGTLIDDCHPLRQQLGLPEGAMSRGFARGWRPALDRDA